MSGHLNTETLSAYLDGELAAGVAAPLGAHLTACADCTARLEDLQATAATLRNLERPGPPLAVGERLRRQLAAERQRRQRPLWLDALLPWRSLQPGLAAAALVFVTALLVVTHFERVATRNAEMAAGKSEMRSLEEREREAAAAPTVELPPALRTPAERAEPGTRADSQASVTTQEVAEAGETQSADAALEQPADAVSAQAAAAPASPQAARSGVSAAGAPRDFSRVVRERTAAERTFVSTGGRWLERGLALEAGPVEQVERAEPLSMELLRRWPDLGVLLQDRVPLPVRMRYGERILELQP